MSLFTKRALIVVVAILTSACASAPVVPLPRPAADAQGEVIVFREPAFAAGGVALSVGSGTRVFASLSNSEKVRAAFPSGEHEIYVQARSAEPTRVRVTVRNGAAVCLRTSSSPSTYAKVVVPIVLMVTGYHFYLDELPCPTAEELSKYKDAPVSYQ
jgi:hypothetical protein